MKGTCVRKLKPGLNRRMGRLGVSKEIHRRLNDVSVQQDIDHSTGIVVPVGPETVVQARYLTSCPMSRRRGGALLKADGDMTDKSSTGAKRRSRRGMKGGRDGDTLKTLRGVGR